MKIIIWHGVGERGRMSGWKKRGMRRKKRNRNGWVLKGQLLEEENKQMEKDKEK
jgi:hypothetical protein